MSKEKNVLSQVLLDLQSGKPLKNGEDDMTVSFICLHSLLTQAESVDPVKNYVLAGKVNRLEQLKPEDIVYVKASIQANKAWTPLVIGATVCALDGE